MKISKRHIGKTLSWRLVGSADTLFLTYIFTGSLVSGLQITGVELLSKMILYYYHEKIWFRSKVIDSRKRHIYKTFTWRLIGTTDTLIISTIISGNPFTGIKISGAETVTKMLLYYIHEKLWYKINFGLDKRYQSISSNNKSQEIE